MNKKNGIWLFFGAVYVVSASLYALILRSGIGMASTLNKLMMVGVAFTPSLLGIVFVCVTYDRSTRRDFWHRIFRWPKASLGVVLVTLFGFPALNVIAYIFAALLGGESITLDYASRMLTQMPLLVQFLLVEFFLGAVSEELGWRGYALDQLQSRFPALTSSLILGVIWALWHTPSFLIPGLTQYEMGGIFSLNYVCMMVAVVAGSVIHTWSYNHTGRSILLSGILLHFMQNAVLIFLGGIFDQFTTPELFWPILSILAVATSVILVRLDGTRTLAASLSPAQT